MRVCGTALLDISFIEATGAHGEEEEGTVAVLVRSAPLGWAPGDRRPGGLEAGRSGAAAGAGAAGLGSAAPSQGADRDAGCTRREAGAVGPSSRSTPDGFAALPTVDGPDEEQYSGAHAGEGRGHGSAGRGRADGPSAGGRSGRLTRCALGGDARSPVALRDAAVRALPLLERELARSYDGHEGSAMARKIKLEVSGFDEVVTATLLDEEEPEYAGALWEELEAPIRMWTVHTASTGEWFLGRGRPSKKAMALGTQAAPLGHADMMCDIEPGAIVYNGHHQLGFGYGPDVTEPLPTHGPVVARVDDRDAYYRAGQHVCDSHFRTHELVTVTVSREEG